jgi:hypothetical protein
VPLDLALLHRDTVANDDGNTLVCVFNEPAAAYHDRLF